MPHAKHREPRIRYKFDKNEEIVQKKPSVLLETIVEE